MEVISIERSTYEELLTSFNSFVAQMRALADRGTDKVNQSYYVCNWKSYH